MRAMLAAVLVASAISATGCWRNTAGRNQPDTAVRVENQSFSDYNIFVVPEGGTQVRLGLSPAKSTRTFVIPATVVAGPMRAVRFLARPIATQTGPVTEDVTVSPGDTLGLQIPPS